MNRKLTLDFSDSGKEDILLQLLVTELLLNGRENRLDEVLLFLLTNLSLVTNPRVENRFDVGRDSSLLTKLEGLVFELSGLLLDREGVCCRLK
jgi:hypothetical protein